MCAVGLAFVRVFDGGINAFAVAVLEEFFDVTLFGRAQKPRFGFDLVDLALRVINALFSYLLGNSCFTRFANSPTNRSTSFLYSFAVFWVRGGADLDGVA